MLALVRSIPPSTNPEPEVRLNLWRVAWLFDEHPHAQKPCETICYEPEEARLSQHLLFPEAHGPLPTAERKVVRQRRHTALMRES